MTIAQTAAFRAALTLVDAQVEQERRRRHVPGISAGVVYDQELVWSQGYGHSVLDGNVPADADTIYRVASISKLFTATMLMQLRDAGKLNLDDPIEKYLPEFKVTSPFPDARPITFRQIVSHASGMTREGGHIGWQTMDMPVIETLLELAQQAEMRLPTMTEPKYSNIGIAILGHALSRIAGVPYQQWIDENILGPLGMSSSGFDRSALAQDKFAQGYHRDEARKPFPSRHWDEQGFKPAGGMYSTVNDIAKFISLQFREGPAGGAQILGGSTLREMHQPVVVMPDFETGFGIGWGMRRQNGLKVIGHSGGLPGYTTNITLVPSLKLGVIVFTNYGTNPVEISNGLLETLIPVVRRTLAAQQPAPDDATLDSWAQYLGRYVSQSADDFLDIEIVDDTLVATSIGTSPAGFVRLIPHGPHQFKMQGGAGAADIVTFEVGDDGSVTGVWMGSYPLTRKKA
jgi:CubicO group peptidase (beta-lactamase class C family)